MFDSSELALEELEEQATATIEAERHRPRERERSVVMGPNRARPMPVRHARLFAYTDREMVGAWSTPPDRGFLSRRDLPSPLDGADVDERLVDHGDEGALLEFDSPFAVA